MKGRWARTAVFWGGVVVLAAVGLRPAHDLSEPGVLHCGDHASGAVHRGGGERKFSFYMKNFCHPTDRRWEVSSESTWILRVPPWDVAAVTLRAGTADLDVAALCPACKEPKERCAMEPVGPGVEEVILVSGDVSEEWLLVVDGAGDVGRFDLDVTCTRFVGPPRPRGPSPRRDLGEQLR